MTRLQRLIKVKESAASYMTLEETAVVTDKYALKCLQSLLPRVRLLIQNSLESTQEIYRQAHTQRDADCRETLWWVRQPRMAQ